MDVLALIETPDVAGADGVDTAPVSFEVGQKTIAARYRSTADALDDALVDAVAAFKPLGGRIVWIKGADPASSVELPVVGVSEFGELKGVSRQHASAVSQRADFPRPRAILRSGPVWDLADVALHEKADRDRAGRSRRRR